MCWHGSTEWDGSSSTQLHSSHQPELTLGTQTEKHPGELVFWDGGVPGLLWVTVTLPCSHLSISATAVLGAAACREGGSPPSGSLPAPGLGLVLNDIWR